MTVNDKSILKTPYFFKWSNSKEAERLRSIFTTPYTFLVFRLEKHQSIYYCHLSKEIMYQSGIGYNNNIINQQRYGRRRERKYRNSL